MEYDKIHAHNKDLAVNHAYLDKILQDLDRDLADSQEI